MIDSALRAIAFCLFPKDLPISENETWCVFTGDGYDLMEHVFARWRNLKNKKKNLPTIFITGADNLMLKNDQLTNASDFKRWLIDMGVHRKKMLLSTILLSLP